MYKVQTFFCFIFAYQKNNKKKKKLNLKNYFKLIITILRVTL